MEGTPKEERVGEEDPMERLYHPSSSPSPAHIGNVRVEEGRHVWEGESVGLQ